MSATDANGQIILGGSAAQRLPTHSVYLTSPSTKGQRDTLYELVNLGTDGVSWDLYVSKSTVKKFEEDRKRKQLGSHLTFEEVTNRILKDVIHHCDGYEVIKPPQWWVDIPKPELDQVSLMQPKRFDANEYDTVLKNCLEGDDYVLKRSHQGFRVKAHFFKSNDQVVVRFDSWSKNKSDGVFREVTPAMGLIARSWGQQYTGYIKQMEGTILECEIVHDDGARGYFPLLDMDNEQALTHQREHGLAKLLVHDCIRFKNDWVIDQTWEWRQQAVKVITDAWKIAINDTRRSDLIELAPYWRGVDKVAMIAWGRDNNRFLFFFVKKDGLYKPGKKNDDYYEMLLGQRFYAIVSGHTEGKTAATAPHGLIGGVKIAQSTDGGDLREIGLAMHMGERLRKWFTQNRPRSMGMVVEVEADFRIATGQLKNPRILGFREDITIEQAHIAQSGF